MESQCLQEALIVHFAILQVDNFNNVSDQVIVLYSSVERQCRHFMVK